MCLFIKAILLKTYTYYNYKLQYNINIHIIHSYPSIRGTSDKISSTVCLLFAVLRDIIGLTGLALTFSVSIIMTRHTAAENTMTFLAAIAITSLSRRVRMNNTPTEYEMSI